MIIYKSKYSKICDQVGHPKPKTQKEEDYCQFVEWNHQEMAKKVLDKMLKK